MEADKTVQNEPPTNTKKHSGFCIQQTLFILYLHLQIVTKLLWTVFVGNKQT